MFHQVPPYYVLLEVEDGNQVLGFQVSDDGVGGLSRDLHPVAVSHGARGVEGQGHVDRPPVSLGVRRLDADAGHVHPLGVGVLEDVGMDSELVGPRWLRVPVAQRVDPLLGAHVHRVDIVTRLGQLQGALVGCPVGVQAEGGNRVLGSADHGLGSGSGRVPGDGSGCRPGGCAGRVCLPRLGGWGGLVSL